MPQGGGGGILWPGWFPSGGQAGKNESTIATWLQDAGYVTGYIGKYLNGYGRHAPEYRAREGGRQFLLVAAGGHGWSEAGDAVIAYALPQAAD